MSMMPITIAGIKPFEQFAFFLLFTAVAMDGRQILHGWPCGKLNAHMDIDQYITHMEYDKKYGDNKQVALK